MRMIRGRGVALAVAVGVLSSAGPGVRAQTRTIPWGPGMQGGTPPQGLPAPQGGPGTQGTAYTMGEIGRRAAYGQDGPWLTAASSDGALVFTGRGESAGWTADVVRPPSFPYTVQVELDSTIPAAEGRAVGAGLIFGFNRPSGTQGRSFYAALVTGDTLTVYRYDGSFDQVMRTGGSGSRGRRATLRVTVRENGFTVSLNGNGSASQDTDDPMTGEYGVMASGEGQAAFRNLDIQSGTGQ